LHGGEKISGMFVVAGRNGVKVLNFIEEARDEVTLAVEREVALSLYLAVAILGDILISSA
jgi:hypothetical protein